ncbi:MAG: glycosyltransferase family protein [Ignavibacteriales bacterium]|nr:glycosyltransferase family protein [Ignavibacteriales bacterium]
MKVIVIIQARTSSTRLPNKVMMPILDKPILLWMIERISEAKLVGEIVVATSKDYSDDVIEELCKKEKIKIFRGNLYDLLDRHYQASKYYNADLVVKIPSDCPLIDPKIIDKVIGYYLDNSNQFDYVSNLHPATYPDGNDVEIMSMNALELAWDKAEKKYQREHTTPYIWENTDKFSIGNVTTEDNIDYSMNYRYTIDYFEDYLLIKKIYEGLYPQNSNFTYKDIIKFLDENKNIKVLNRKYLGRYWYENYINEIKNIDHYKNNLLKII